MLSIGYSLVMKKVKTAFIVMAKQLKINSGNINPNASSSLFYSLFGLSNMKTWISDFQFKEKPFRAKIQK